MKESTRVEKARQAGELARSSGIVMIKVDIPLDNCNIQKQEAAQQRAKIEKNDQHYLKPGYLKPPKRDAEYSTALRRNFKSELTTSTLLLIVLF